MEANGKMRTGSTTSPRGFGRRGRILRSQTGQALLEVAVVTPLLLLLLVGTVELGRYAYIGILVGNAARAGAAYGAQGLPQSVCSAPAPCGIQTAADNDFQSNGQPVSALTVTASDSCGCDSGGTITSAGCNTATNPTAGSCTGNGVWVVLVSVTASGTFSPLFNYPGISKSFTISRTSTMRVAQD